MLQTVSEFCCKPFWRDGGIYSFFLFTHHFKHGAILYNKSQRTTNAPIWLAYSIKSNFSALPQNSVFPFSAEISLETKTSFKKNRYKQTVKVINHIYGNMFIFLASYLKEIP